MTSIEELERLKVPRGEVTIVGLGRLGIRVAMNLIQVHRGGAKVVRVIDGQRISEADIIHRLLGGKVGEYKVDLVYRLRGDKVVVPIREYITPSNLDLISGDVVCITIAGGNTIPITASIVKRAWEIGAMTISTAGVFGIDEEVRVMDVSEAKDNVVADELRSYGITKNHKIVTTGKFIRDKEPITPYVLDEIARVMTAEILRFLLEKY
jgi:predicted ThiF/HesA family dinucleotide-utilizing enzyme